MLDRDLSTWRIFKTELGLDNPPTLSDLISTREVDFCSYDVNKRMSQKEKSELEYWEDRQIYLAHKEFLRDKKR